MARLQSLLLRHNKAQLFHARGSSYISILFNGKNYHGWHRSEVLKDSCISFIPYFSRGDKEQRRWHFMLLMMNLGGTNLQPWQNYFKGRYHNLPSQS
jgi:hypothetical protein